jgi:hypothetical protein
MGEEKRKAHILAVQYIELLASQTGTKMEPWDLAVVFGTGKSGHELVTDKTEINKIFFAKIEEIKTKTPAQVFAIEARVAEQIDASTRLNTDRILNDLRRNRDRHILDATRAYERIANSLVEAHRIETSIMAVERRESTVSNQISQLIQENFWDFHELHGGILKLSTKNDVVLTHKNPAAGVDIRLNMGRYLAHLNLSTMGLSVFPYEDNLILSGYPHPHITESGNICWGSASNTVHEKLPTGQVMDVFRILASLLVNYNDSNPYIALAQFQAEAKKREAKREKEEALPPIPSPVPMAEIRLPDTVMGRVRGWAPPGVAEAAAAIVAAAGGSITVNLPPVVYAHDGRTPVDGCSCPSCRGALTFGRVPAPDEAIIPPIRMTNLDAFMSADDEIDF